MLVNVMYPWKLLVEIHHVSTGIISVTAELYTTWLEKQSFTVINVQPNGVVQLKHLLKSVDEKSVVHWTTPHLTLLGMKKVLILVQSYHVYVVYIPPHQNLVN